jgi:NADH:ubiquinone reductase (non-electrogenic)
MVSRSLAQSRPRASPLLAHKQLLQSHLFRRSLATEVGTSTTEAPKGVSLLSTPLSVQFSYLGFSKTLPTQKVAGQSRWRSFLQILGRVTLVTIITGAGTFYYITQKDRHPGAQLPFDPEKKTIVVLGSGWGATSLLKTLDTTDYNVVSTYRRDRGGHTLIRLNNDLQVVVSPKNYFLFTPLLPSVAVGTLSPRSILQRE